MRNRSYLVGGALLLAVLFLSSCNELMSSLDNPVSSYLKVGEAEVTIPTGDTYQIKAETINSDNPITYESSDPSVLTVDAKGLVTALADGEATVTVSVAKSEYYNAGEVKVKVAVKRPLTFEALEDGSVYVDFKNDVALDKPIYYSVNDGEKVAFKAWVEIPLKKGQKVEFESANDHVNAGEWAKGLRFWPGMECAVYGNVMSLISPDGNYHVNKEITAHSALYGLFSGDQEWVYDPNEGFVIVEYPNANILSHDKYKLVLPATTLASGAYGEMFKLCTGLKEAPELPATTLGNYCYEFMFDNCQNLKKAPALPATKLAEGCYYRMFYNTAITTAPALPATEVVKDCYAWMFQNCSKLKNAPDLPATKLADNCYASMFSNSAITTAPALPATKLADDCYSNMFYDCKNLEKAPALPATELAQGCYSWMFQSCLKLEEAPALPATELKLGCYAGMFYECTSLQKAPDLIAETLVADCYMQMFEKCTKLNYLRCLGKNASSYSVYQMLSNAGTDESVTERTFERDPDTYWMVTPEVLSNALYVPEGWTITPPYEPASAPKAAAARQM